MIRINEFMRQFDTSKMTKEEYWNMYVTYKNLPPKEKKKYDSVYVSLKKRFTPEERWDNITQRVREGKRRQRADLKRPFLVNSKIEKLKEEVNSEEWQRKTKRI